MTFENHLPHDANVPDLRHEVARGVRNAAIDFWNTCRGARGGPCFSAALSMLREDPHVQAARDEIHAGGEPVRTQLLDSFRNGLQGFYEETRGLLLHALRKPFGYPGDFSALEYVYDRSPHPDSTSTLGQALDRWAEDLVLPRAVRARKDTLRFWLERYSSALPTDGVSATVLSVAAGAAREIREMDSALRDRLDITLLDSDNTPLAFALACLSRNPSWSLPRTVTYDAVAKDFRKVLPDEILWNVVYSFGLIDYLPDALAVRLLKRCKTILAPEGRVLFCLKDSRNYDAWVYDWFFDWRFVSRIRDDGHVLAARAGLSVQREYIVEDGVITIYECVIE